ncbi:unnamed protein product [Arabidopsis arenosa]|uniref:Vesicle transport v-SNARE N-terminal domain-containing protein n=1 Tax=Arabidopsis arenosa TaxID=38785 RepID=A0A8S2AA00_ARAAE|nr:unnamed protein product [Arabidopsis arenosa]
MWKITESKSGLEEAGVLIGKVDLEARSLQLSAKALYLSKLKECKSDLNQLKKELKRVLSSDTKQSRLWRIDEIWNCGSACSKLLNPKQKLLSSHYLSCLN